LYLPAYTISPEEIFQGKILLFNVDFFNTGKEIKEKLTPKKDEDGDEIKDANGNTIQEVEYYYYLDDNGEEVKTSKQDMAADLRGVIQKWYVSIRNIAIVAMMIILLYIGIRMILSTLASDKAKYKQMLQDWFIGLLLLFFMHYIMAFSVTIVQKVTDIVGSSVDKKQFYSVIPISSDGGKADKFKEFIKEAKMEEYYVDENGEKTTDEDEAKAIIYPSNLLGYIRIALELTDFGTVYIGKAVCFLILVLMTIYFVFSYLRRVLYMAFLTIIAPLVAMTYPIDKLNDGSAQGFDKWFKEYIFNLLLQPMHLLLYYILITSAWNLSASNILYSIVALGFMIPAEKLLRNFFGFEKAHTPGLLAGPGGAALTMGALSKMANLGKGKDHSGKGQSNGNSSGDDKGKITWANRGGELDEQQQTIDAARDNDTSDFEDNNRDTTSFPDQDMNDYYTGNGENDTDTRSIDERINQLEEEDYNYSSNPEWLELQRQRELANNQEGQQNTQENEQENNNSVVSEEHKQSRIRQLARNSKSRAGRKLRAVGGGIKSGFVTNARKQLRNAPKNLGKAGIKFASKAAVGTALGAVGLAAGVVSGDPNKAFQYATTAGAAGMTLGGRTIDGVLNGKSQAYQDAYNRRYNDEKYDDLKRKDYIKDFKQENVDVLKANLGKDKYKEMKKNGSIDKFIDNGIDNVDDMIAAQRMIDAGQAKDEKQAAAYAKYANRVGSDYNTSKATEWEERFTKEYIEKSGLNDKNAKMTARSTMKKIEQFNKNKKNIK